MKFEKIAEILGDIPYTRPRQGKILYDFICTARAQNILELGFAHGVSTCYLAAALDEQSSGTVLTMDFQSAAANEPNIFSLLKRTNLERYVSPILSQSSYTWELMKIIEQQTQDGVCHPKFDFCFIDGGHLWDVDGFAFFLVDKLLKPGSWVLFDDVYWTYTDDIKGTDLARSIPEEQRSISQIERVFSLLVCQHPHFQNMEIREKWGWAQKRPDVPEIELSCNVVRDVYQHQSLFSDLIAIWNKLKRIKVIQRAKKRNQLPR